MYLNLALIDGLSRLFPADVEGYPLLIFVKKRSVKNTKSMPKKSHLKMALTKAKLLQQTQSFPLLSILVLFTAPGEPFHPFKINAFLPTKKVPLFMNLRASVIMAT